MIQHLIAWLALRGATKVPGFIRDNLSGPSHKQRAQHAAEVREKRAEAGRAATRREERRQEDARKGLVLPPREAAALYQKGMDYWHGSFLIRQDRAKAREFICQAARNGDENARMMANMNGWDY